MDVRDWPLDMIMQLPDHAFGRRWPVIFSGSILGDDAQYYISELALPERCVLWEIFAIGMTVVQYDTSEVYSEFSVALGDQLPATAAEFVAFETLFPGADEIIAGARSFRSSLHLQLRQLIQSTGRRVVLRYLGQEAQINIFNVGLVFSSIPTEVPDCLLSI